MEQIKKERQKIESDDLTGAEAPRNKRNIVENFKNCVKMSKVTSPPPKQEEKLKSTDPILDLTPESSPNQCSPVNFVSQEFLVKDKSLVLTHHETFGGQNEEDSSLLQRIENLEKQHGELIQMISLLQSKVKVHGDFASKYEN